MRRLLLILRLIPLTISCALFLTAALRVQADRAEAANRPALPTQIGSKPQDLPFLQATIVEMNVIIFEFGAAILPGFVPEPVLAARENTLTLDALKTRQRGAAFQWDATGY